jgi:hypothetical protein
MARGGSGKDSKMEQPKDKRIKKDLRGAYYLGGKLIGLESQRM